MAYVNFYYELDVYKMSRQLAKDEYLISKSFPQEERYSLTDQIRRSSRSIGAQIAKSWAKRRYINHFISKLSDSDAEQ
ncbi:four helix bundle protein [Algoriphagus persicinus]|uniref:four helix bundle protein n=1 Tax=Algoriphagus persicinus TaxID=3108754 RepID=UPI002B387811|nr:four helix bundle protein [Algoriphagus sp. E1-3-M2]MEB2783907.1 four helix bundle protein [Algoriphagus sp. E1-3-M2]